MKQKMFTKEQISEKQSWTNYAEGQDGIKDSSKPSVKLFNPSGTRHLVS
jgi:hypothetical protein